MREQLPGAEGYTADVLEQASKRLLSESRAAVEIWWLSVEQTVQEPRLPGARDARDDGHHVPLLLAARLQSLVDELLSPLITQSVWGVGRRGRGEGVGIGDGETREGRGGGETREGRGWEDEGGERGWGDEGGERGWGDEGGERGWEDEGGERGWGDEGGERGWGDEGGERGWGDERGEGGGRRKDRMGKEAGGELYT